MGASHLTRIGDWTVVKSNPSGNIVRFTITDAANLLTTTKMIRAVLWDALGQFITAESGDLSTNGDGSLETEYNKFHGDPSKSVTQAEFDFDAKVMDVTLTALTNIAATGNITVSVPYADV